jgi:hypothetical protein
MLGSELREIRRAARRLEHSRDNAARAEELEELLRQYGWLRMVRVRGFRVIDHDRRHRVTLWARDAGPDDWLGVVDRPRECILEMENPTVEDGTRERFGVRVPSTMVSARQAVAWTHGLEAHQYNPKIQA